VTNFRPERFPEGSWQHYRVVAGLATVSRSFEHYAEARGTEPFLILGSSGFLEISIDRGSAARMLAVDTGHPVVAEPPDLRP
jgi:S-adenosylmethionine hydrolase